MKIKCSTPKCRRNAVLQLLGDNPLCRKCGDEKNRRSRARSKKRRQAGHYPPSTIARWEKRAKLAKIPYLDQLRTTEHGLRWVREVSMETPQTDMG